MHADGQLAVEPLGRADQPQREAEVAGVLDVLAGQVLDPLVRHVGEMHRGVEGQPREDRHLRGGVLAGDVVGRIRLGVAEPLRVGQRVRVRRAGRGHLGEDVVGGAVDDPVQPLDVLAGQRLLEHPDHRHDARHRGLEPQLDPVLARDAPQLLAVLGQQLLVRGDDVLARPQRPQHVVTRHVGAAHHLDDQVAAGEDLVEVAAAARQHPGDLGAQPRDVGNRVGALGQQLGDRGTHGAVPEQTDAERGRVVRRHRTRIIAAGGGSRGLRRAALGFVSAACAAAGRAAQSMSRAHSSSIRSRRTTSRAVPPPTKTTGARGTPL